MRRIAIHGSISVNIDHLELEDVLMSRKRKPLGQVYIFCFPSLSLTLIGRDHARPIPSWRNFILRQPPGRSS